MVFKNKYISLQRETRGRGLEVTDILSKYTKLPQPNYISKNTIQQVPLHLVGFLVYRCSAFLFHSLDDPKRPIKAERGIVSTVTLPRRVKHFQVKVLRGTSDGLPKGFSPLGATLLRTEGLIIGSA